MLRRTDQPKFQADGLEVMAFDYLINTDEYQKLVKTVYSALTPARNAKNRLSRGLRWGILANNQVLWSTRNTYQLGVTLNPEEGGRVRTMDLLPNCFVEHPLTQRLIEDVFRVYYPNGDTSLQPYVVQVSGIRYQPTPQRACYPSPDAPHQDGFDSAIVVIDKTENLLGGHSRIYTLEDQLRYEAQLQPGQAMFVRDSQWKHQVCPMLQEVQIDPGPCFRDILIVRIDPANR